MSRFRIGSPPGALVWLALRRRTGVKVFLLGAAGFFVSQMLVRQPLLALLGQTDGYRLFTAAHPVAQALFLALTAGLAEETARYLVFCLLARNKQPERGTPLWYGLGHGGLEAVLVGLNSVVLLAAAPETLAAAGGSVALAGVERIAAMTAQVALSFVAYCALRHRGFLLWAILLHGLYDFCIVLQLFGLTPLALEGVMMVFSLLLLAGAVRLWKGGPPAQKGAGSRGPAADRGAGGGGRAGGHDGPGRDPARLGGRRGGAGPGPGGHRPDERRGLRGGGGALHRPERHGRTVPAGRRHGDGHGRVPGLRRRGLRRRDAARRAAVRHGLPGGRLRVRQADLYRQFAGGRQRDGLLRPRVKAAAATALGK